VTRDLVTFSGQGEAPDSGQCTALHCTALYHSGCSAVIAWENIGPLLQGPRTPPICFDRGLIRQFDGRRDTAPEQELGSVSDWGKGWGWDWDWDWDWTAIAGTKPNGLGLGPVDWTGSSRLDCDVSWQSPGRRFTQTGVSQCSGDRPPLQFSTAHSSFCVFLVLRGLDTREFPKKSRTQGGFFGMVFTFPTVGFPLHTGLRKSSGRNRFNVIIVPPLSPSALDWPRSRCAVRRTVCSTVCTRSAHGTAPCHHPGPPAGAGSMEIPTSPPAVTQSSALHIRGCSQMTSCLRSLGGT
jgi:hypothetical protein